MLEPVYNHYDLRYIKPFNSPTQSKGLSQNTQKHKITQAQKKIKMYQKYQSINNQAGQLLVPGGVGVGVYNRMIFCVTGIYPLIQKIQRAIAQYNIQLIILIYMQNHLELFYLIIIPMNKLALLLILLSIHAYAQSPSCGLGMSPNDLIQTGTLSVAASSIVGTNRQLTFSVPVSIYTVPASGFQVTASLSQFVFSSAAFTGYDFVVGSSPSAGYSNAQIYLFINNDGSWTKITITYIITSRADLFLGAFAVPFYLFSNTATTTYNFKYSLPNWNTPSSPVASLAQIAGLRSSATSISSIKINSAITNTTEGFITLSVTFGQNTLPEILYFSYVIWLNTPALKFSAFMPSSGSSSAYQYVGVGQISSSALVYNGLAFAGSGTVGSIPCTGPLCASTCVPINDCISRSGVIANITCYLCNATQTYQSYSCQNQATCGTNMKLSGTTCVCQDNAFFVNSTYCAICPQFSFWNMTACACNYGYYFSTPTTCVPCPSNSVYNPVTANCSCNTNYNWNNGQCVTCPIGFIWNAPLKACTCPASYSLVGTVCVPICPNNSISIPNGCQCNQNFMNVSGQCLPCPPQSVYIPSQLTCLCLNGLSLVNGQCITCGTNAAYDANNKVCVCLSGYYNISGVCTTCPPGTQWNGSQCLCPNGLALVGSTCQTVTCGTNEVLSGNTCVCQPTFTRFGTFCSCPLNSQLIAGKCVCNQGTTMTNGACLTSTTTNPPNTTTNTTTPANTTNTTTNTTTPTNTTTNPPGPNNCPAKAAWDGTQCVCIPTFNMIDGQCKTCQPYSKYNVKSKTCICEAGFYGTTTNCFACDVSCKTCTLAGPAGCATCKNGYKMVNGACTCNTKNCR